MTDVTGRLTAPPVLARNSLLNLLGQAAPVVAGLALTPFTLHRLGDAAFGVLSLVWAILGLTLIFNFGLGRATTKYAAECLARGDDRSLASLLRTSVALNVALGVVAAVVVGGCALWLLAHDILRVPPHLRAAARLVFVLTAATVPFTFVTSSLRAVLEGGQRFGFSATGTLCFSTAMFVLPALAVATGRGLAAIGVLLAVCRVAETITYAAMCARCYPALRHSLNPTGLAPDSQVGGADSSRMRLRALLRYGGWLSVTNVLVPLLVNLDRFVIGALLSVGAVAVYSVSSIVTRLSLVPSSVTAPLFAAFATLDANGAREKLIRLHAHSLKYMLLVMAACVAVPVALSAPFLRMWVGESFAQRGSLAMQVLAIGILANAVAALPYTVLQAAGRVDVTAKCHTLETPISVAAMLVLTARYGIAGSAVAWSFRTTLDLALLVYACLRLHYLERGALARARCGRAVGLSSALVAVAWGLSAVGGLAPRLALFGAVGVVWGVAAWHLAFEPGELRAVTATVKTALSPPGLALR